eukprot:TRINITY_DN1519_c0_g2_i2.p1 TRINITY_DN1519_c0_g2~~TRINITY_DN1519_c0_g2_i2.p1  ORF type:complete len:986 (-),score=388.38 TRINITY_DN1519_c0_g2_i2:33-2990(-)
MPVVEEDSKPVVVTRSSSVKSIFTKKKEKDISKGKTIRVSAKEIKTSRWKENAKEKEGENNKSKGEEEETKNKLSQSSPSSSLKSQEELEEEVRLNRSNSVPPRSPKNSSPTSSHSSPSSSPPSSPSTSSKSKKKFGTLLGKFRTKNKNENSTSPNQSEDNSIQFPVASDEMILTSSSTENSEGNSSILDSIPKVLLEKSLRSNSEDPLERLEGWKGDEKDEGNEEKSEETVNPKENPDSINSPSLKSESSQDSNSNSLNKTISPLMKMIPMMGERSNNMASLVCMNEGTKTFFETIESTIDLNNSSSSSHSSLTHKDSEGNTWLHYAAMLGQVDLARQLLLKGAKVNETNNRGVTPLHFAVCKSSALHAMTAELFLNNGAKVNAKTNDNETPLHYAVVKGRTVGKSVNGNMWAVALLCKWRADPSIQDSHLQKTPLHYAAQYGYYHISNVLLERSPSILDTKDENGNTSLHLAIMSGNLEVVRLLLLRKANIYLLTEDYSTVLHLACKYQKPRILDLLFNSIQHQIQANGGKNRELAFALLQKKDKHGFTCVHYSAIRGDIESLKQFPDFLNARDNIGTSPCNWSVVKGNKACLLYLISKDSSLLQGKDEDGPTPENLFPFSKELGPAIESSLFCDLSVIVEGSTVNAHKIVLYRCFRNQIKDNGNHQTLTMEPNIKKEPFLDLCKYLYTGEIPSEDSAISGLLEVANAFQFIMLKQICETAMLNKGKLLRVSTLPQYLGTILDKNLFSDVIVEVERRKFRLHRFVLGFRCIYLMDLLKQSEQKRVENNGGKELENNERRDEMIEVLTIQVTEVPKDIFACVVDYLYTDVVRRIDTLSPDDIRILHKVSKKFGLAKLTRKCEFYLFERIDDDNVADIYGQTDPNEMPLLRKGCIDYLAVDLKRMIKSGRLDDLSSSQMDELKRRKKELGKEGLDPSSKKKAKKSTSFTKEPETTPEVFFSKRTPMNPMTFAQRPSLERRNSMKW